MQHKASLSLVVITYNEEKNLERCLSSVKGIVDEIVVLDSGSTDRTAQVAQKHRAVFHVHPFDGHIEQKNRALTFVKTDWVLSLDADEALDPVLADSIRKELTNPLALGYTMNRLTNYCGHWVKHCGWYPDKKLRLWKHGSGEWSGINPHDRFVLFADKYPAYLKGNILHYSYHSVAQHKAQAVNFAAIAAKHLYQQDKTYPAWQSGFRGVFRFIRDYFFKLGFLDGKIGFTICRISAWSTYNKYRILHQLVHEKREV